MLISIVTVIKNLETITESWKAPRGTEKTLSGNDGCTGCTIEETLTDPGAWTEGTEEALWDPKDGTEGTRESLRYSDFTFNYRMNFIEWS